MEEYNSAIIHFSFNLLYENRRLNFKKKTELSHFYDQRLGTLLAKYNEK